jgi:hypothetical protein
LQRKQAPRQYPADPVAPNAARCRREIRARRIPRRRPAAPCRGSRPGCAAWRFRSGARRASIARPRAARRRPRQREQKDILHGQRGAIHDLADLLEDGIDVEHRDGRKLAHQIGQRRPLRRRQDTRWSCRCRRRHPAARAETPERNSAGSCPSGSCGCWRPPRSSGSPAMSKLSLSPSFNAAPPGIRWRWRPAACRKSAASTSGRRSAGCRPSVGRPGEVLLALEESRGRLARSLSDSLGLPLIAVMRARTMGTSAAPQAVRAAEIPRAARAPPGGC